jgi:hypothetical protein
MDSIGVCYKARLLFLGIHDLDSTWARHSRASDSPGQVNLAVRQVKLTSTRPTGHVKIEHGLV